MTIGLGVTATCPHQPRTPWRKGTAQFEAAVALMPEVRRVLLGYQRSRLHPAHRRPRPRQLLGNHDEAPAQPAGRIQVKTNIALTGSGESRAAAQHVTRPARRGRRIGFNRSGQGRPLRRRPDDGTGTGLQDCASPGASRPAPTGPTRRRCAVVGAPTARRCRQDDPHEASGLHSTTADPAATGFASMGGAGLQRRQLSGRVSHRPAGTPFPAAAPAHADVLL